MKIKRLPCAKGAVAKRLRECLYLNFNFTIPPPRIRLAPPFTQGRLFLCNFTLIQLSHFSSSYQCFAIKYARIFSALAKSSDKIASRSSSGAWSD